MKKAENLRNTYKNVTETKIINNTGIQIIYWKWLTVQK